VLAAGLNVRVGDAKGAAPADFKEFGGLGGFFGARFRGAAGPHFAGSEVQNAGFVAAVGHFQECAAAGEFHVVGMGSDGEQVKVHARSPVAFILLGAAKYTVIGVAGKSGSRAAALQITAPQASVDLMITLSGDVFRRAREGRLW